MATKTKRFSERQMDVLAKACTHGHLEQGCRTRRDYGGLACTINSLKRAGLLDAMSEPTELGRQTHAATLRPNRLANRRRQALSPASVLSAVLAVFLREEP